MSTSNPYAPPKADGVAFVPPEQVFALLWAPEKGLTPLSEGWGFFNRYFEDYCTGGDRFGNG